MRNIFLAMLLAAQCVNLAHADQYGTATLNRMYVREDGWVYFGVMEDMPQTCKYYNEQFRFDSNTAGGKNILSVLLSSIHTDKRVQVWYRESPLPGTNQATGCVGGQVAIVFALGIL